MLTKNIFNVMELKGNGVSAVYTMRAKYRTVADSEQNNTVSGCPTTEELKVTSCKRVVSRQLPITA